MSEPVRLVLTFFVVLLLDVGAAMVALAERFSWTSVLLVTWIGLSVPIALLAGAMFTIHKGDESAGIDGVFGENPT